MQATSHYLNQWWLVYRRIYASLGLNEIYGHVREESRCVGHGQVITATIYAGVITYPCPRFLILALKFKLRIGIVSSQHKENCRNDINDICMVIGGCYRLSCIFQTPLEHLSYILSIPLEHLPYILQLPLGHSSQDIYETSWNISGHTKTLSLQWNDYLCT